MYRPTEEPPVSQFRLDTFTLGIKKLLQLLVSHGSKFAVLGEEILSELAVAGRIYICSRGFASAALKSRTNFSAESHMRLIRARAID